MVVYNWQPEFRRHLNEVQVHAKIWFIAVYSICYVIMCADIPVWPTNQPYTMEMKNISGNK